MNKELNPYVEHGNKKDNIKKITVSVPVEIYETIQKERKRRIDNKMRHATASEILCEAFAHAFTGQALPQDEELFRYMSKARMEQYKLIQKQNKDNAILNSLTIAETFVGYSEFREIIKKIIESTDSSASKTLHIYRLINLMTTFVLSESVSHYALALESQHIFNSLGQVSKYKDFIEFIDYNIEGMLRSATIASEIKKIINK